jgi:hypothetical protein
MNDVGNHHPRGTMSALNGDKARFQRLRKAGLRRRDRSRLALTAARGEAARIRAGADGAQASPAKKSETL